jgi:hypothetical protein
VHIVNDKLGIEPFGGAAEQLTYQTIQSAKDE